MAQYYFAYGADMDLDDLGLRCDLRRRQRIQFAKWFPAVLPGYELYCNIPSSYRSGGIFNVIPNPKAQVHGVVYELHAGDTISTMMVKEGQSKSYLLHILEVKTVKGKLHPALVLQGTPTSRKLKPSPAYVDVVIDAARKHRLPAEWIAHLQTFAPEL